MRTRSRRALPIAGAFGALVAASSALAEQPTQPLPPGSPLFGRPNTEAAMKLAPILAPTTAATPEKVQEVASKLTVLKGFKIEPYVSGLLQARSLRFGDKGTLFVSTLLADKVYGVVVEKDGKRQVKIVASGLYKPNGIAFKDGTLYIAELSRISKLEKIEDNLDDPPKPIVVYDNLPKEEANGWKFIGIGPDGKLYVPVGQPCNNCIPPDTSAQIRRINLDGTGTEVVARGVRNTVGFDWHPVTKQLYFTDNGRDWVSEDLPEDELNRVTKPGEHFGSPYCHQGDFLDPEFGWGHSCGEFTPPVAKMGPHTAPLGMRFYTGTMFPAKYKNAIFVARHGSWNRTKKLGGDIVAVFLNPDGTVRGTEVVVTGFIGPDNNYIGRPVDVQMMKDGSLLISDDYNGAIYRLFYGNARSAGK